MAGHPADCALLMHCSSLEAGVSRWSCQSQLLLRSDGPMVDDWCMCDCAEEKLPRNDTVYAGYTALLSQCLQHMLLGSTHPERGLQCGQSMTAKGFHKQLVSLC